MNEPQRHRDTEMNLEKDLQGSLIYVYPSLCLCVSVV